MSRPEGLPACVHIWTSHWHPETPHRKGYCRHAVHSGVVSFSQCSRKEKVQEYGLGWCKQHAPSAQVARNKARDEKFKKSYAADRRRWATQKAHGQLADTTIRYFSQEATHEELEAAFLKYAALRDAERNNDHSG